MKVKVELKVKVIVEVTLCTMHLGKLSMQGRRALSVL